MLTLLGLQNFKAFGKIQMIEFAPITLLFGENSAGKSSILQALNLLKQSREEDANAGALVPSREGGIVNLGTCSELMHDHGLDQTLSIALFTSKDVTPSDYEVDVELECIDSLPKWNATNFAGTAYSFRRWGNTASLALSSIATLSLSGGKPIETVCFSRSSDTEVEDESEDEGDSDDTADTEVLDPQVVVSILEHQFVPEDSPLSDHNELLSGTTTYTCRELPGNRDLWAKQYQATKVNSNKICEFLRESLAMVESWPSTDSYRFHFDDPNKRSIRQILEDELNFFSTDFTVEQFIAHIRNAEIGAQIHVRGLDIVGATDTPVNRVLQWLDYAKIRLKDPVSGWLTETPMRYDLGQHVGHTALRKVRAVTDFLNSLTPLGPVRQSAQRWYAYAGTRAANVGFRGELLSAVLLQDPEALADTNEWLERLGTNYSIELRQLKGGSQELVELRMVDTARSSRVDVSLADVGYGISQILPFIVQSLSGSGKTITIEQPEVHIHPRLQADLGSLLSRTIRSPYCNRYIIETHSEHLVLRLQRLIRKGKLRPKDVAINYVSRGKDGSRVQRLKLDDDGDFIDDWPGGFFPERLRELS